jgi:hypothetical protein
MNLPKISLEKDAHYATLHSHLSIWALCLNKDDDQMSSKLEKAYQKELRKALEKCQFIESNKGVCS